VLNAAAQAAGWGKPPAQGVHRGIAHFMGYASYSAAVAEVSVSPKGELKIHRLVVATDCGNVVNPDQVAAQTDGATAMGLSNVLFSEITIEKGRVVEKNFHNYGVLRLAGMPKVESVLAPTHDFWGGVGEPTICVIAPAVMNAIFAATGKPVRSLPIKNLKLV
jgi:isoquinoline 1-oxidoreductase beta subunit